MCEIKEPVAGSDTRTIFKERYVVFYLYWDNMGFGYHASAQKCTAVGVNAAVARTGVSPSFNSRPARSS